MLKFFSRLKSKSVNEIWVGVKPRRHSIEEKKQKDKKCEDIERPIDRDKAKEYKIPEGNSMAF